MFIALIKKEIDTVFRTPIASIFLFLFFLFSMGLFFFGTTNLFVIQQVQMRQYFSILPILFIFFLPAFTMHQWSEERKLGTFEILRTLPIPAYKLVLAKWLASLLFLTFVLIFTIPLPITLSFLGSIDSGQILSSYIGSLLLGVSYLAFGLFISSLVKDQIVAFLLTVAGLLSFNILSLSLVTAYVPQIFVVVFQNMSLDHHFEALSKGVLDSRNILFLVSFTVFFLYANYLVIKQKHKFSFIILFLLALLLALTNRLGREFFFRLDLTAEKEFTLSQSTKKILQKLDNALTIKIYTSKDLPAPLTPIDQKMRDTLIEIKNISPQKIKISYHDADSDADKVRETEAIGIVPAEINIKTKDKIEVRKIYMGIVFYYQDKKSVIPFLGNANDLEYLLMLNTLKLITPQKPKIGLLIPDDEHNQYQIVKKITEYFATTVDLSQHADWEMLELDAALLIKPELGSSDVMQLDNLLTANTNLIIFSGKSNISQQLIKEKTNPGLDDFFTNKGVFISNEMLVDFKDNAKAIFQEGGAQILADYPLWVKSTTHLNQEHPITAKLEEIVFPWSHAIVGKNQNQTKWQTLVLSSSSDASQLQKNEVPNMERQYLDKMVENSLPESYPLAVILKHDVNPLMGQIFLSGSHHMLEDAFFQRSQSNVIFFQNVLEYFSWGDHLLDIRSRGKTSRPLVVDLTETQKNSIKWFHLLGLPTLATLTGIFYLLILRRIRNKKIYKII